MYFVDFAKAFYLINCRILFYKVIVGGWYGPVIDTIFDLLRVNWGFFVGGILFWK